jgi:predicted nucleic acid-binding protein
MAFAALLDANILHPIVLCDLLLRLAEKGLYRPLWSPEILAECRRSILRKHDKIDPAALDERLGDMNAAFPDASVSSWEALVPSLKDEFRDDAHVVAAAITGRADTIVTENTKDSPLEPTLNRHGITVQTVDEFLVNQWWLSPPLVRGVVVEQAAARKQPRRTPLDLLAIIAKTAPEFAGLAGATL